MTSLDDRILEYLQENKPTTPTKMTEDAPMRYSRQHVDRRCKKLDEEGLVEHLGNGVYMITGDGEAYLNGRLDTENWRYIDNDVSEATATDSGDLPEESNGGAT